MSQLDIQTGVVNLTSPGASALRSKDTSSFTSVKFPKPFPDGSKVIVVPMTQTFNGPDTPGLRISHVTTTGFMIRINELVGNENHPLSDGKHEKETIGWAAFTLGDLGDFTPGHQIPGLPWHGTLDATNERGVETHVTVKQGDVISVAVTGKARVERPGHGSDGYFYGPEGNSNWIDPNAIDTQVGLGAVLMKIGNGEYIPTGNGLPDYKVQHDGEIAFYFNDVLGKYDDNYGSFTITVTN